MKFDASTAPEALEYDFTPWGGVAGTIPEPTDAILQGYLKFYDDLSDSDAEAQLRAEADALTARSEGKVTIDGDLPELPGAEPEKAEPTPVVKRTLQEIILGDEDVARRAVDAVGELCQQSPSAEQIWALPTRIRNGFASWVSNILIWGGPEGNQPAGTSGSPAGQNGDGDTTSPAAS